MRSPARGARMSPGSRPVVSALRNVSVGGFAHDIQTYVVGMGDTVANPSSVAAMNQFAALGGTTLFETSAEVRRDISAQWGVAAFVDAGAVGSTGPVDLAKLAVGVGFGARYNLGRTFESTKDPTKAGETYRATFFGVKPDAACLYRAKQLAVSP